METENLMILWEILGACMLLHALACELIAKSLSGTFEVLLFKSNRSNITHRVGEVKPDRSKSKWKSKSKSSEASAEAAAAAAPELAALTQH